ncbi:MAG: dTMP kinase [Bosea sp. (in: a-proteobacteria)]
MAGRFITLEGGEGAGKSTLAKALSQRLQELGHKVTLTREPGGSAKAEAIREVILSGQIKAAGPVAEALMFYAARADHLDKLILPALKRDLWIICDRFSDSTRAYQGALGRIDAATLRSLERIVVGQAKPDLTLMLDLPPEIGLARADARRGSAAKDRFEGEGIGFHRRLRQAFLDIAAAEPARCIVIDAAGSQEDVAEMAWSALTARLNPGPEPA